MTCIVERIERGVQSYNTDASCSFLLSAHHFLNLCKECETDFGVSTSVSLILFIRPMMVIFGSLDKQKKKKSSSSSCLKVLE